MTYKDISKGILRSIGIIIGVLLLLYFLWLIRSILGYIFIAFALSLMGRPIARFLTQKLKFSSTAAAGSTLALIMLALLGFAFLIIPLVKEQAQSLSLLDYESLEQNIRTQVLELDKTLEEKGLDIFSADALNKGVSQFNLSGVTDVFGNVVGFIGTFSITAFSVLFIAFFFLKDKGLFNNMLLAVVPDKDEQKVLDILSETKNLLSRYFLGLVMQAAVMFILYLIILLIFGINHAFIIALICGVLNLIPYLGPVLGALMIGSLSMSSMFSENMDMQTQILPNLMIIMVLYLIAQLIDNFVNQPIIYSKSVKSHPLEIFIVMLIAGTLFGVVGVVFAIPGYTVLRLVLKQFFSNFKVVQSITKDI